MNRDSLHDEDEAFEQMDAPQATNADRNSDKKRAPEKDIRAPLENESSLPPIVPPIAGRTRPGDPQSVADSLRNSAPPNHLLQARQAAELVKREMELANITSQKPPVDPNKSGMTEPAPPNIQGTDARLSFGTIAGQMKKEIPPELTTRLNTVLIICYINMLFLLLYFPITVAVRYINEPNSLFSSRGAFIIYLTFELLNLLVTVLTYKIAEGLTRPILKCWVWFMLLTAIGNLVLGIVVFSYATEDKSSVWNSMNLVTKRSFNNDSESYKSFYRLNMALIGIFLIIELIVFLIMSFVVYLLFSILLEDGNYKPKFGRKPFTPVPFLKKNDIGNSTFGVADYDVMWEDLKRLQEQVNSQQGAAPKPR